MAEANYRLKFISKEDNEIVAAAGTDMTKAASLFEHIFYIKGDWQVEGNVIKGVNTSNESFTLMEPCEAKEGEDWIAKLEASMQSTLRDMLPRALAERETKERLAWMGDYPFQILQLVERIRWTSRTTAAIENNTLASLLAELKAENEELIMFLRGSNSAEMGDKAKDLLIYGSHYVYVTERLIGEGAYGTNNFTWRTQLRGYYDESANQAYLQIHEMRQDYKYNYLGHQAPLVITPLTEKMYAQMFECLETGQGYAACGPAGCGKTETVKNLACDLGRDIIVINCSDMLKADAIQIILETSAKGDIYVCFDEFNRIVLEELNKIATFIPGMAKCPWFITMNPGYAGRTELPANIKDNFLRITVFVPDLQVIYEMMLFSEGFKQGRSLGNKLAYFLGRARDVFSPQMHYDWGLRCGKALVRKAGLALRTKSGEITDDIEHQVLLESIDIHAQSVLVTKDRVRYEPFIVQLTYGLPGYCGSFPELEAAMKNALESQGLKSEKQVNIANCLYDNMKVRHGVALIGAAGCGKKTILNALSAGLEAEGKKPIRIDIDADAASHDELYKPDGKITMAIRQSNEIEGTFWIIIKGGAGAEKVEPMNTVLDDNKKLCLETHEIIPLSKDARVIYLLESAEGMSPATISRLGITYVNEEDVDFK